MGSSVNNSIDKDRYIGVVIELAYPTINSFAIMVRAVEPGVLMYKCDLHGAYRLTHLMHLTMVFFWQGHFISVLYWLWAVHQVCICITTTLVHIHNSWGALSNYLNDFIEVASPEKVDRVFCKLEWLLQDIGVW